jgi:hypothetical protein
MIIILQSSLEENQEDANDYESDSTILIDYTHLERGLEVIDLDNERLRF